MNPSSWMKNQLFCQLCAYSILSRHKQTSKEKLFQQRNWYSLGCNCFGKSEHRQKPSSSVCQGELSPFSKPSKRIPCHCMRARLAVVIWNESDGKIFGITSKNSYKFCGILWLGCRCRRCCEDSFENFIIINS